MVKLIGFLRPDLKRIIVLLIILSPIIVSFFQVLPFPKQFGLLNTYFSNYIVMIPFLMVSCYFGGFDCGGLWVPVPVFYILTYSFGILVWYLISCLVVSLWNNIFRQFGEKNGQYEQIVIKSLIVIFILAIILPVIGSFFIIAEINTRQNISLEEVFRNTYPEGTNLQEIKIRNYFVFPVSYELPNVNVCLYDADENSKIGIYALYRAENGRYLADMDQFHRNVIVAWPFVEEVVHLQYQGESSVTGAGLDREKFDEILLLTNVGTNSYDYCNAATEEDILASEKIKISAQGTLIQSSVQKPSAESTTIENATIEKSDEYIYNDGHTENLGAPIALLKISSATPTSIQLHHQGGDYLKLSELQFTVKKANREELKPSVSGKSDSNVIAVGDTIILSSIDFGKSGDTIEIIVTYKRMNIDIVWIKTQIRQNPR